MNILVAKDTYHPFPSTSNRNPSVHQVFQTKSREQSKAAETKQRQFHGISCNKPQCCTCSSGFIARQTSPMSTDITGLPRQATQAGYAGRLGILEENGGQVGLALIPPHIPPDSSRCAPPRKQSQPLTPCLLCHDI